MIFSSNPKISEQIISLLADGPLDSLILLDKLQHIAPVTKQGFYRALRELLTDEVITKNKQLVILSPVWASKVANFVSRVGQVNDGPGLQALLNLSEGDTMVFRFKSAVDLYLLWIHYFFIFCEKTEGPVIYFNSHNFWALFRSDIENEMYAWVKNNKKLTYSVSGHNLPLDRVVSDSIQKEYGIEVAYEKTPSLKDNVYPAIFGDYIMATVLDMGTVEAVHELYQKYDKWEPAVQYELEQIIGRMKRSKVVIERNQKKAEKLRKKLLKYFIFYK